MQNTGLKYGTKTLCFYLPEKAEVLKLKEPVLTVDPATFEVDLAALISRLKPALKDVAVVVADKTRLCAYSEYLPGLVKVLEDFGVGKKNIVFYIAYGTHQNQSDAESIHTYGSVFRDYRFVHHDCDDAALFKKMGETSRGTPVLVRRDILNAGFLITFGAVTHHYFAGYGGGRKLLFPGLGFRKAVYHNHGLFLDKTSGCLAGACRPGSLEGNPLAGDIDEAVDFRPADLAIHGIVDSHGKVCRLITGSGKTGFKVACREQGRNCEIKQDEPFDLVAASCGGYPKDINFIQSHKAIHNAAGFVRDKGILIVFARCRDGIGSDTFLPWFEMGGYRAAFNRLAQNYAGNGGTALAMMEKTKRIRIHLVTDLPEKVCLKMGVARISVKQAGKLLQACSGKVGIIPNASLLVKV